MGRNVRQENVPSTKNLRTQIVQEGCKGVKVKLFGSGYDATEGLGVNQLAGGVALPKFSIKSRC